MHKEVTWLLGELKGLVSGGVLDESSAERLRVHYAQAAAAQGPGWGMILLSIAGAALVGLGVILIFAHNWENWTPGVRVALSFAPLLLGQLAAFYTLKNGGRLWQEGAGMFTALAIGASIALIAQTYQFGGDLPQFLLVWTLLALPLIYLLDSSAVAALCWLGALGWVWASQSQGGWGDSAQTPLRLPAFLSLLCLPLPHLLRHIRRDRLSARVAWMLRVALVALALGLPAATSYPHSESLWFVYASLAAAAVLAGRLYFSGARRLWGNPLEAAGLFGVFVIALLATYDEIWRHVRLSSSFDVLPFAFGSAALALAWKSLRQGDRFLAPVLAALTPLLYLFSELAYSQPAMVSGFAHLYALALAAALIRSGLQQARLGLANQGVALLAALVLMRFFDSDLSYIVRGVGFIVTGVGFFVAIVWLRRRVKVGA